MAEERVRRGLIEKYVFNRDHKAIAVQYLLTALIMAIAGGVLATLIRIQLTWPDETIVRAETYLSLVTTHGTIMVFFVVWLALISGIGHFVIPLMIGARNVAYPVLSIVSFWIQAVASGIILLSLAAEGGAAASGWTSLPPLSAVEAAIPGSGAGQTLWIVAMLLFILSFALVAMNYIVTIWKHRVSGLSFSRLPVLIWTLLVSSILGLIAFPSLAIALVLLLFDRSGGTSFFLPAGMIIGDAVLPNAGGSPVLFKHLFWFMGHPATYVLFLPSIGIATEVISTFSRRPPFVYREAVIAIVATAPLSLLAWGQHMFFSNLSPGAISFFTTTAVLMIVPVAVLLLNLIATMWRGRLQFPTAMLFAIGMISAMLLGGLGGVCMACATTDMHFHETFFVVAHLHFVAAIAPLFAIFAATYYWFPKMIGRCMSERLGKLHFWLTISAIFPAFLLMYFQGLGGSPRHFYDPTAFEYIANLHVLNLPISVCAFVAIAAQLVFLSNVIWSVMRGQPAEENPWNATTLEWTTPSPAPRGNWLGAAPAVVGVPYSYHETVKVSGEGAL